MAACLSITFIPNELKAAPDSLRTLNANQRVQAEILTKRLEEINGMNKSALSRTEKKALRKEVRTIERSLRDIGGGVYISAGAIIVILILLIIFL